MAFSFNNISAQASSLALGLKMGGHLFFFSFFQLLLGNYDIVVKKWRIRFKDYQGIESKPVHPHSYQTWQSFGQAQKQKTPSHENKNEKYQNWVWLNERERMSYAKEKSIDLNIKKKKIIKIKWVNQEL